jgi:tetratricopeptide (TPR) repeat protein
MKCDLDRLALFIILTAGLSSPFAYGQGNQVKSNPIDLDKELEAKVEPSYALSYYHYALAKWNEDAGEIPKALSEMQIALRYNENSSAIHLALAALLEKSGDTAKAIETALKAARLDPKDPDPHWLLANIYFRSLRSSPFDKELIQKAVKELEELKNLEPSDERAYYALGGAYFELGEFDKGIQAYEKFQSLAPSADDGFKEIAKYYDSAGKLDKALEYMKKAIEIKPDSTENLMILGSLYSKLNKENEAAPLYRKASQLAGNSARINRQLAASLLRSKEYKEADKILEELLKISPQDKETRYLSGQTKLELHETQKALDIFQSLLREDPNFLDAEYYLGIAYEQAKDPRKASEIFARLIKKTAGAPEDYKANRLVFMYHLARNYQRIGNNDKAIAIFEDMIKNSDEPNLDLYGELIDAYRMERQFDKAVFLGKEQSAKNPDNVAIGYNYGRALAESGKTKEGISLLSRMLQADPDNLEIYITLNELYLQQKRFDDAEKIVRGAEEKKLDAEITKYMRATIYERQKDFNRAELLFKEILKENPKNASVLNYMGYMLADRGVRLQEAVGYVKEALAIDPNNGAYLDSLGWAFFKLNDMVNAEKFLLEAIETQKFDGVIGDHLGELYFKIGNLQKAHDYWTQSVSNTLEPDENRKVRQKLDKLKETLRKQKRQQ